MSGPISCTTAAALDTPERVCLPTAAAACSAVRTALTVLSKIALTPGKKALTAASPIVPTQGRAFLKSLPTASRNDTNLFAIPILQPLPHPIEKRHKAPPIYGAGLKAKGATPMKPSRPSFWGYTPRPLALGMRAALLLLQPQRFLDEHILPNRKRNKLDPVTRPCLCPLLEFEQRLPQG